MGRKRKKTGKTPPAMSGLELEVMDIVWKLGDCTSNQVIKVFSEEKRRLAPTTIRTILGKLREKGYVRVVPSVGRSYLFRAAMERPAVARRTLGELLTPLFENSPRRAIAYLLEDEDISDSELDEIRRLIEARRGGKKKGR